MIGEELNSSHVTERSSIGHRQYAVIDREMGKVASAKNPGKWVRLFNFRAAFTEPIKERATVPPVLVTLPGGSQTYSDNGNVDYTLSRVLGRQEA